MIRPKSLGTILLFLSISGCAYENREDLIKKNTPCEPVNVSFKGNIMPIINTQCLTCHNRNEEEGDLILENYTQVKEIADDGSLIGTITHAKGFDAMPRNAPKLSSCQIETIRTWINEGTQDN